MDVLRHTGARRTVVVRRRLRRQPRDGPRAVDDRALHRSRPASRSSTTRPTLYGAEGEQVVEDVNEFVAGINAYINEALHQPEQDARRVRGARQAARPNGSRPT